MTSLDSRAGVLAVLALAALVALPAVSQEAKAPSVAAMATTPGSISWAPKVSFDKLVLTVEGSGFTSTREFRNGSPTFAPVDPDGYQLADGTYTWELTVIPRALDANNHHYRSDERSADGRSVKAGTAPRGLVESGSFTIANGAIVDPGLTEPVSEAAARQETAAAEAEVDDSDAANP